MPGNFAKTALTIGQLNGDIGDIQSHKSRYIIDDAYISLQRSSEKHLMQIVEAVNQLAKVLVFTQ